MMILFLLHKLILQTRMRSHPVGLDVWFLVGPFVYLHTSCVWIAKALARLRRCSGLPEPLLVAYAISTIISWAGSFIMWLTKLCLKCNSKIITFCHSLSVPNDPDDSVLPEMLNFWQNIPFLLSPVKINLGMVQESEISATKKLTLNSAIYKIRKR